MRDTIVTAMAKILWASAWADHVEEQRCRSLSACNICEIMPPVPELAEKTAKVLAADIEMVNGVSLEVLYQRAMHADRQEDVHEGIYGDSEAERFGECLAFEAMGAGVSWADDHAEFEHVMPGSLDAAEGDLMFLAHETCEECKELKPKRAVKIVDELTELVRDQGYQSDDPNAAHDLAEKVRSLLKEHHFVIW